MNNWLQPVEVALSKAVGTIEFFFRNDDAGWSDERLYPMLDLFQRFHVPIDLAVIPTALGTDLTAQLLEYHAKGGFGLHTHGFNHTNHESEGRNHEFGPSRSHTEQMSDLSSGKARLEEALGKSLDPIFTPPWNRCTPTTAECLDELGYRVLSRDITAQSIPLGSLQELSVSVDWLRKRKGQKIEKDVLGMMIAEVIPSVKPVGIMLHHAVMDDDGDLSDVEQLLTLLSSHSKARCMLMQEFMKEVGS